jgi:hypothetical protein
MEELISAAAGRNLSATQLLLDNPDAITNKKVRDFGLLLQRLWAQAQELQLMQLINHVVNETGYGEMLADGTSENEARLENLKER